VAGTGGTSGTGGATGTGGTTAGARIAGACQAGTSYPAPILTGAPKLISKPSGSSSGTYEGPVWLSGNSVLLFSDVTFTTAGQTLRRCSSSRHQARSPLTWRTRGPTAWQSTAVVCCSPARNKVQGIVKLDYAGATLATS